MSSLPRPSRKITEDTPAEKPAETVRRSSGSLRPSDIFLFDPKPDMTAYELACLIKRLYEPTIHFKSFLDLPDSLQRHFRPTKA